MVFVFNMDVPLVELIFVLTIILSLLLIAIVFIISILYKLKKRLDAIFGQEASELTNLKRLEKEENQEIDLLKEIGRSLDKVITSEIYTSKVEALLKPKGGRKLSEKDKIKIIADSIRDELVKMNIQVEKETKGKRRHIGKKIILIAPKGEKVKTL